MTIADGRLRDDINSLVKPPPRRRALPEAEPRAPIPAQRGTAELVATAGGISSPLTEVADTRVVSEYEIADPLDPNFVVTIAETIQLNLLDAGGQPVRIILQDQNVDE